MAACGPLPGGTLTGTRRGLLAGRPFLYSHSWNKSRASCRRPFRRRDELGRRRVGVPALLRPRPEDLEEPPSPTRSRSACSVIPPRSYTERPNSSPRPGSPGGLSHSSFAWGSRSASSNCRCTVGPPLLLLPQPLGVGREALVEPDVLPAGDARRCRRTTGAPARATTDTFAPRRRTARAVERAASGSPARSRRSRSATQPPSDSKGYGPEDRLALSQSATSPCRSTLGPRRARIVAEVRAVRVERPAAPSPVVSVVMSNLPTVEAWRGTWPAGLLGAASCTGSSRACGRLADWPGRRC